MLKSYQETFVSKYSWLVAPGDHLQADYTTPTRVNTWLQAGSVRIEETDKQQSYGQWIAQLLQNQLGVQLVSLYYRPENTEWPITLSAEVIAEMDNYFNRYTTT